MRALVAPTAFETLSPKTTVRGAGPDAGIAAHSTASGGVASVAVS